MSNKINWIALDIETLPTQPEEEAKALIAETIQAPATMKKKETIDAWHAGEGKYEGDKAKLIEDTYLKTSFDGGAGSICSIAWENGRAIDSLALSENGDSTEAMILEAFAMLIRDGKKAVKFVGHNIRFDLKFLHHRFVINGIDPNFDLPFSGRHKQDFYCTSEEWAGYNQRVSQKKLCALLGFKGKPDDIDGSKVYEYFKAGRIEEIERYNRFDVETVRKMYNKLNFIKG